MKERRGRAEWLSRRKLENRGQHFSPSHRANYCRPRQTEQHPQRTKAKRGQKSYIWNKKGPLNTSNTDQAGCGRSGESHMQLKHSHHTRLRFGAYHRCWEVEIHSPRTHHPTSQRMSVLITTSSGFWLFWWFLQGATTQDSNPCRGQFLSKNGGMGQIYSLKKNPFLRWHDEQ